MGWFWKSPAPSRASTPGPDGITASPQTTKAETEAAADAELQKFLDMIQAEFRSSSGGEPAEQAQTHAPPPPPPAAEATESKRPSSSSSSSWFSFGSKNEVSPTHPSQQPQSQYRQQHQKTTAEQGLSAQVTPDPSSSSPSSAEEEATAGPTIDPDSPAESQYPTEMSCRNAFDLAFHCQGPAGQWNAVYRSGGVRTCSEHWDDFWFCMRVKGFSGPLKAEMVRAHYRAKEAAKYAPGQPSSEDVWAPRRAKVAPGTAFVGDMAGALDAEEAGASDAEWQVREIERRRALREQLGIEGGRRQAATS